MPGDMYMYQREACDADRNGEEHYRDAIWLVIESRDGGSGYELGTWPSGHWVPWSSAGSKVADHWIMLARGEGVNIP